MELDKRVQKLIDDLIEEEQQNVICKYDLLVAQSESFTPIEQLLWLALQYHLEGFSIQPQAQIGKYRVDFLVELKSEMEGWDWKSQLVIECDGHDFHERTKEQAINDKTRDRELQRVGIPVIRFSGSEIWKDPQKCAEFVHQFIGDLREREWRKRFETKES
jgi:very-short-patch-repair endonuclease